MDRIIEYRKDGEDRSRGMYAFTKKELLTRIQELKNEGATDIKARKYLPCKHCHGDGYTEVADIKFTKEINK